MFFWLILSFIFAQVLPYIVYRGRTIAIYFDVLNIPYVICTHICEICIQVSQVLNAFYIIILDSANKMVVLITAQMYIQVYEIF